MVRVEQRDKFCLRVTILKKYRPVNLDLTTIRLPVMAVVSILHRISGIILFAIVSLLLWLLSYSLDSEAHFQQIRVALMSPWIKLPLCALSAALIYHIMSGIRHLLMDFGLLSESRKVGQCSAWVVLIVALATTLVLGVAIW